MHATLPNLAAIFGATPAEAVALVGRLTPRERQVLRLIALGHFTDDIARRLGISHRTAGVHRHNLRAKLDGGNTADVTRLYLLAELTAQLGAAGPDVNPA